MSVHDLSQSVSCDVKKLAIISAPVLDVYHKQCDFLHGVMLSVDGSTGKKPIFGVGGDR